MSSVAAHMQSKADGRVAWPAPAYAWYVIAVLIAAYAFAILDRSIISLLVDPIKKDLGVTDSQIGLLQSPVAISPRLSE